MLLSLDYLTSLFYYIPKSALAAVIIMAVAPLFDTKIIGTLWRVKSMYFLLGQRGGCCLFPDHLPGAMVVGGSWEGHAVLGGVTARPRAGCREKGLPSAPQASESTLDQLYAALSASAARHAPLPPPFPPGHLPSVAPCPAGLAGGGMGDIPG